MKCCIELMCPVGVQVDFILLIRDFSVFGRWSPLTPGGFTWTPCGVYVNFMWIPCNNLAGLPAK